MDPRGRKPLRLLVAEDDTDDQLLLVEALREADVPHEVNFVPDGAEMLAYLNREGSWSDPRSSPRPSLVLLDLNMPRVSGFEVLERRQEHPTLRVIPVIVMTSSWSERDIARCYSLGANAFITKPVTFDQLVNVMGALGSFWLETCELPSPELA
ncbi:MAG: response regulator [Alphaproteobacteria bacterium]|nr:response regulator [Alphaproteobacteria bacterium]